MRAEETCSSASQPQSLRDSPLYANSLPAGMRRIWIAAAMMFVIPTLNVSDVFVALFYTYRNYMFVIPTLNISEVLFYDIYLSEFGFRYSYFTHI